MITLLYAGETVGPVCRRVAEYDTGVFKVVRDTEAPTHSDVLIRWGSRGSNFSGTTTVNTGTAVTLAQNKLGTRRVLGELAPRTWAYENRREITYPCVVRPRTHRAGSKFFVCRNLRERRVASRACHAGWYASELVNKAHEYRVFVLDGYVVCVSERFPGEPGAVAWNLALGGRLINLRYNEWPVGMLNTTVAAVRRLGLDWAAMDVAVDTAGRTVVFEANTAPGLRNPYTLGQIGRAFASLATQRWKQEQENPTRWQDLVHPALR